jgi:protein TonB
LAWQGGFRISSARRCAKTRGKPEDRLASRRLLLALTASVLAHAGLLSTAFKSSPLRFELAAAPVQAVLQVSHRSVPVGTAVAQRPATGATGDRLSAVPEASRQPLDPTRRAVVRTAIPEPATTGLAKAVPDPSLLSDATPAPGASQAAVREGVSPDDLRQYRLALAIAARRFKRYPPLARERGWEGRVEVAVSVSAWQPAPQSSLVHSSGHASLDEQALSMIEKASASTMLPESLKGREFRVLLPIEFTLDDDR